MNRLVACVVAIMVFSAAEARAEQHVAVIKNLSPKADIKRNSAIVPASSGFQLLNADIIQTGPNGYVGIIFIDGTAITIGPDSEFRIDSYVFEPNTETYDFAIYLKKGSALFNTGKIGKLSPESVNLSTPRATVGIRGTRFIVDVH
ncbi:FecR family protein [bacterium]|nr:FecR family protein [bacterium]